MNKLITKYKKLPKPLKATLWFTLISVLQRGISFLAVPIFTRIMTTEQYGTYSVFLSWLEIFEIVTTFRLGWGGYIVGLTKFDDDRDRYTSSMQCLSLVITGAFLLLYLPLSGILNGFTGMDNGLTFMMFGIMFALPAIQFWTVRGRVEYRYIAVFAVTMIASVLTIGLGTIFAVAFEDKVEMVVAARVIVQGIEAAILIWINCHKDFCFFHKGYWKRALKFNVPLLPYYLSMVLLHSSDRIIIRNLIGAAQAGIYGVAYTASMCMQIFSTAFNQTLQPWMYKKMKDGNIKSVKNIINMALLMVAVLNLLMIALAPEVVRIMAPKAYHEAIWVIPPLCASVVVMFFYQHFVNIEFYFEESKLTAAASIGAAVLNIALNHIFVPIYGYFAAGYTTLASYLVFAFAHYLFMRIVCRKHNYTERLVDIRMMLLILVAFFVCTAVLMVGYEYAVIRYIAAAVIAIGLILNRKKLMKILKRTRVKKA